MPQDRSDRVVGLKSELPPLPHVFRHSYGSPEFDQTTPRVAAAVVSGDGRQAHLTVEGLVPGHVHDFDLQQIRSAENERLVHAKAYYTLNEIPKD